MRKLTTAAGFAVALALLLWARAALTQSAPMATTAPSATGSASADTTPPPATGSASADTTPPATGPAPAATTPPAGPLPSWTPVLPADVPTPPATGPSSAGTTPPPMTGPSSAGTAPKPPTMLTDAPPSKGPPPAAGGHVLNFNEAPIDLVLKYLAESVGLQVIKQAPMTDVRVTIMGQQPIFVDDTVALLNSVLYVKGYVAIRSGPDGRILKIVTVEDAKRANVPVFASRPPSAIPATDDVITQIISVRYMDAIRLRQDLTPLLPATANITSNAAANVIIMTDTSANVKRIAEIVWGIDMQQSTAAEVRIYQLKFADATSAASLITNLFRPDQPAAANPFGRGNAMRFLAPAITGALTGMQRGPDSGDASGGYQPPVLKASADVRTNTIVVTGPSDSLKVVDAIIKSLDSNTTEDQAVFIYALKNAVAANLAGYLNNLFGTTSQGRTGTTSGQGMARPQGFGPAANTPPGAVTGLVGQVYVVADVDVNSLMVMTQPKNFEQVKGIIREMDRSIPQVLITVLIAEVTHDVTDDLGAEWSVLNLTSAAPGSRGQHLFTDLGIAAATGGFQYKLLEKDYSAAIRALQTIGNLDVLSRPCILTSDNQAATITDGQKFPFITETRLDVNSNTINTIQYQNLGIILKVTPHINPEGLVTMDINQEIDTLTGQSVPITATVSAPVFDTRIATCRVAIRNGQTIVIGGLIQDQKTDTIKKIPLLGDIPLIGKLFQHTVTDKTKSELLIFLTPRVAMTPEQLKELSEQQRSNAGQALPNAVEPGAFDRHMNAMQPQTPDAPVNPTTPDKAPGNPQPADKPPEPVSPPPAGK